MKLGATMTSAKTPFQVSPRGAGVFAAIAAAALMLTAIPLRAQTAAEDLRLTVGKSVVIDYPSQEPWRRHNFA